MIDNKTIGVIGLGYVGLPLAIAFGKKIKTIGYDLKKELINHYQNKCDPTGEVITGDFEESIHLSFTSDPEELRQADYLIVAVPTPIDIARQPDFSPLKSASEIAGKYMKKNVVVIFESTVFPGATEDICVPILEKTSTMKWKTDFNVGYSPERINPGDKEHTLAKIIKIVSADSPMALEQVAKLYEAIIEVGVYKVDNIKEAEAAKVIENTQRDLNIALMNELSVIFDRMGIDTLNVLNAAKTKWNFLPFHPGLVGGHCIGVDPYYLTHKAETLGYHPEVILAGRRINDNMGKFIAEKTVKLMIKSGLNARGAKAGILGLTFKEDCPDLRNTKVVDIIHELESFGIQVLVHDPIADPNEAKNYYNIDLKPWDEFNELGALIIAVGHKPFFQISPENIKNRLLPNASIIDVKSTRNPEEFHKLNINFWRL